MRQQTKSSKHSRFFGPISQAGEWPVSANTHHSLSRTGRDATNTLTKQAQPQANIGVLNRVNSPAVDRCDS
jgi:hypothetical protein